MAHTLQQCDGIGAQSLFHPELVRQPLVVDARSGHSTLNIESMIDNVHDDLQCCGNNSRATGAACDQEVSAIVFDDCR